MREQFIATTFRPKNRALLAECEAVIDRYLAQGLKLSLRQLYYQLVSSNTIPNTERSYKNLGSLVSRGRLAGILDWQAIEDRIRVPRQPSHWSNPASIMRSAIDSYRLDRWQGQGYHVELWVEKDALAGVLAPIANQHHITLMVNRGYSSQSAMYDAAQRVHEVTMDGRGFVILYLGDLDPSGEDMVRDIDDRLNDQFGAECEVRKLAITPAQVAEYQPPPQPAKRSDSRARRFIAEHGMSSYEVDALPPDALRTIINAAISEYIHQPTLARVLQQEQADKRLMERGTRAIMEQRGQ